MKIIPLTELIAQARPLPWPVNAKVEEPGALTFEQLAATRMLRRHAVNTLLPLVKAFEHVSVCGEFGTENEYKCELCRQAQAALYAAKNVRREIPSNAAEP